jgi:hypothetical protein
MRNSEMIPYRFNPFEMDLLRRLTFNVYLKSQHFEMNRWPIIYWGDFERSISGGKYRKTSDSDENNDRDSSIYDMDLLGCYFYKSNEEGFIEIYRDRIQECSYRISNQLNLEFELTRSLLQTIVLLHEIGHWFSHCCFKENRKKRMYVFTHQTRDIKETIAQLSVIWSTLGLRNKKVTALKEIMDFLSQNQSRPYKQYLKLGNKYSKKSTILNRYVQLLDGENCDLDYLLLSNLKMDSYRNF